MAKICLIGAGSTVFAKNILSDVLSNPELADSGNQVCTTSIPGTAWLRPTSWPRGLRIALAMRSCGITWRRPTAAKALSGAHFVILMMQVGGYRPATVADFEIPKRFGLRYRPSPTPWASAGSFARCARFPGAARHLPRHARWSRPGAFDELRQPNGDEYLGGRPGGAGHPLCRLVPQRAGHLGASRALPQRADRGYRFPLCRPQPCRLLPQVREAPCGNGTREDLYPAPAPDGEGRRFIRPRTRSASRP